MDRPFTRVAAGMTMVLLLATAPANALPPPNHGSNNSQRTTPAPEHQAVTRERSTTSRPLAAPRVRQAMSPRQEAEARQRAMEFKKLSPKQQQEVRQAYEYYQSLPSDQQRVLRQQWRQQLDQRHTGETIKKQEHDNGSGD